MTNLKKAAITSILILLFLICLAIMSFADNTGIVTEEANLRKTTSNNSTILEIIPDNEEVEILNEVNDWYEVRYNRIRGYVQKDYIKVEEKNEDNTVETNTAEENQVTNENEQQEEALQEGDNVITKEETILYARPLINSITITNIEKEKNVTIMELMKDWAYIATDTANGWVRLDKLTTKKAMEEAKAAEKEENTNKVGYISATQVNFREKADNESEVITVLSQNEEVNIIAEDGKWYKGQTGYVIKTYVSDSKVSTSRSGFKRNTNNTTNTNTKKETANNKTSTKQTNPEKTEVPVNSTTSSGNGQDIVSYAKQFVGCKYVYGGSSPSGFDCSGFTSYVYKHFGINLSHSSSAQANVGTKVDRANLQPGDLLFFKNFNTGKGIGHVAIYIGNNQFVHASTPKTGVIISSLSGTYATRYVTATRLIK